MHSQPCIDESFGNHHALASVQARWWRIIKEHGCFWTQVDFQSGLDQTARSLRKSQGTHLHIRINHNSWEGDDLQAFMKLIEPHSHRWKSFTFAGSRFDVVRRFLEESTPTLESLHLAAVDVEDGELLALVGGPSLQHIELRSVIPTFSNEAFSNLTTLVLHGISTNVLTLQVLAGLLNNDRGVQCLFVRDAVLGDSLTDLDFTPPSAIVLRLQRLHISEVHRDHTLLLLRTIRRLDPGEFIFQYFSDDDHEIWQELVASRNGLPSVLSSSLSLFRASHLSESPFRTWR